MFQRPKTQGQRPNPCCAILRCTLKSEQERTPPHGSSDWYRVNSERLEHFRQILQEQLRQHIAKVSEEQAAALESDDDGVKDSVDLSLIDVTKEIAFRLTERESQIVADIDQALLRIREGSYGICARCSNPIDERRLEAVPTARYDAQCQTIIESQNGDDDLPTL